jgi:hypothetical protein
MRMRIGRKVAAFGVAAMVVCGAAGTALAASGGTSGAPTGTASSAAVDTDAATQLTAAATATTVTLTYAQLAAKLGVSEKQLLAAVGDFKDTITSTPGAKSAAELKSILVKTLVYDLHISGSAAAWAADELLGGYISN